MKKLIGLLAVILLAVSLSPTARSADEAYTYRVRVFAGNKGTIGGQPVVETSGLAYDAEWTFDIGTVKVTDEKYYVRGIRESGLDNDMVSSAAFRVHRDIDFVVAYGVRGSEVAYTVRFVRDSDGAELAKPVTFYGNVGDKPVVACKFIEGYYPRYYNITGTLVENAAKNVYEFRYAALPAAGATASPVPYQDEYFDEPYNGWGNRNQSPAPQMARPAEPDVRPAEPETRPAESGTFPAEPEELLDLDTPLAGPEADENGEETPSGPRPGGVWIVAGSIALLAALLALLLLLLRRKREDDGNKRK